MLGMDSFSCTGNKIDFNVWKCDICSKSFPFIISPSKNGNVGVGGKIQKKGLKKLSCFLSSLACLSAARIYIYSICVCQAIRTGGGNEVIATISILFRIKCNLLRRQ